MAQSIYNIEQDDELTRYLFKRATRKGFLEPLIDREGNIPPECRGRRFNHKHITALRQIAGYPDESVTYGRLLRWANAHLLNLYI